MNKKKLYSDMSRQWKDFRLGNTLNEDSRDIQNVVDNFVRYLIGNQKVALDKLKNASQTGNNFLNPGFNSKDYNKIYDKLYTDIFEAIKKHMIK